MKITPNILSIPPYISVAWSNISSMHAKEELGTYHLTILLKGGPQVEVPNLSRNAIDTIFNAHAQWGNRTVEIQSKKAPEDAPISFAFPLKSDGEGNVIDAFGSVSQHNPDQVDLPPLPPGVLEKITAITSSFGVEALTNLPKAEPGCNCIYCQIMNALHRETDEEEVTVEDLKFRNWEVSQTADKLYIVTNSIDVNEHYSVFLGTPIGCTCGHKNCEHIRAVLST